jgi:hypothetical protein
MFQRHRFRPGIFILSVFAFIQLHAGEEPMHYSHLTRENGLPSNRTRCVVQDYQGYVWIGTDNGLVRFDGRHTTTFTHDRNDPNSVIDICVNALHETRDSMLLIGTIDGLFVYDPFTKQFAGYSTYTARENRGSPQKGSSVFLKMQMAASGSAQRTDWFTCCATLSGSNATR